MTCAPVSCVGAPSSSGVTPCARRRCGATRYRRSRRMAPRTCRRCGRPDGTSRCDASCDTVGVAREKSPPGFARGVESQQQAKGVFMRIIVCSAAMAAALVAGCKKSEQQAPEPAAKVVAVEPSQKEIAPAKAETLTEVPLVSSSTEAIAELRKARAMQDNVRGNEQLEH